MKKRIILWSLLLMFVLTVPAMASSVPPLESACGFTPPEVAQVVTRTADGEIAKPVALPLPEPVKVIPPVLDSQGEPVTLERTNELIATADKLQEHIKLLQEHIAYLDIIIDKRNQERKESELMYLKLRRSVEK